MKYLETKSTDPYYNLAFEEYVLTNFQDDDYLILWQNDNTIVIGLHQNPLEEINMVEAEKAKVNIVRRTTGGGAVYHDMGNLNFSYITNWDGSENATYEHFLKPIVEAFAKIDILLELKGRNDLVLDGKKISGNAQRLHKGRILHHGTLLINSNLGGISKVLNVSNDKIESKGVKSVRSRVTNIYDYMEEKLSVDDIKSLLVEHWFGQKDISPEKLAENQLSEIDSLAKNKYRTWDWTFSRSPKFNYKNKKRFAGGSVEANLDIQDGIIERCTINGDFLSLMSVGDVESSLIGKRYDVETLLNVLNSLQLDLYFGKITSEELVTILYQ